MFTIPQNDSKLIKLLYLQTFIAYLLYIERMTNICHLIKIVFLKLFRNHAIRNMRNFSDGEGRELNVIIICLKCHIVLFFNSKH